jgi:hypothetical protein
VQDVSAFNRLAPAARATARKNLDLLEIQDRWIAARAPALAALPKVTSAHLAQQTQLNNHFSGT